MMSRRRLVVTLARRRAHAASPNDRLAYAGVPRDPIICLVGGMGPLASAQIHVALVNAVSALPGVDFDDEHPDVVHASFPRGLYDVSPWILQNGAAIGAAASPAECGAIARNPGVYCADVVRRVAYPAAAHEGRALLVGACCNTFHAEPTFAPFLERLAQPWRAPDGGGGFVEVDVRAEGAAASPARGAARAGGLRVDVFHMPRQAIARLPRSVERVGVICSTATRELGIYARACAADARAHVPHPPAMQEAVTAGIYAAKKHGSGAVPRDVADAVRGVARHLVDAGGAQAVVLGCTEIPLVLPVDAAAAEGILAVDAGEALVQRLVRAWREVRE